MVHGNSIASMGVGFVGQSHMLNVTLIGSNCPGFVDLCPGSRKALLFVPDVGLTVKNSITTYSLFALLRCCNGTPISQERLCKSKTSYCTVLEP